ncbi:glycosyl transferase, partial [Bacteroides fragilis]
HYSASWITPYMRLKLRISKILGKKITSFIVKMKRKLKE